MRLKNFLHKLGFNVEMTRDKDEEVPLVERAKMSKKFNADIFISIHANSSGGSPKPCGIESYYSNNTKVCFDQNPNTWHFGKSDENFDVDAIVDVMNYRKSYFAYKLAGAIQSELIIATNEKFQLNIVNRGVKQQDFVVLSEATVPASLIEIGFLTNPTEARLLASQKYRSLIAYSIAQGVERYFVENFQGKDAEDK